MNLLHELVIPAFYSVIPAFYSVIPAQAGIQFSGSRHESQDWIPAATCPGMPQAGAGMTYQVTAQAQVNVIPAQAGIQFSTRYTELQEQVA